VKVCMKSDWVTYLKEEDFDKVGKAMINKDVVRIRNLFGMPELLDAGNIAVLFVSSVKSRAEYEEFEKILNTEGEEEKEAWEK